MNCQDFENRLDALARGTLADARTREEASAHAAACAHCAARLADERALTEGLRELARKSKAAEAPARVESALLAALRAQAAPGAAAEGAGRARAKSEDVESANVGGAGGAGRVVVSALAGHDNITPPDARAGARRLSWAKTVAVAALAAAAALTFFMLIPPDMSLPRPKKVNETAAATPSPNVERRGAAGEDQTAVNKTQDEIENVGAGATAPGGLAVQPQRQSRASVGARQFARGVSTPAVYNVGTSRGSLNGRGSSEDAGGEEIATDFIPLMQGARFAQGDGGRLVRVELPRSALVSFGLPVNAEAAGGRVKADVLLGEDGLARAIRFVR
jgi:hypothetical protein